MTLPEVCGPLFGFPLELPHKKTCSKTSFSVPSISMDHAFQADFIRDKPKDKSRAHGFPRLNCMSFARPSKPLLKQLEGTVSDQVD
jgi:hypothetical protein